MHFNSGIGNQEVKQDIRTEAGAYTPWSQECSVLIEVGKKENGRPQKKVLSNGYWIASIASTSLLIKMP
jgi:hypothetical protein